MRKRHDATAKVVVFFDILTPINWGTKPDHAFELILKHCGYSAIWEEADGRMTLRFRTNDGSIAPELFSDPIRHGAHFAQHMLKRRVFAEGLQGWHALTSDQFSIHHSIATRTIYTVYNRPSYARA